MSLPLSRCLAKLSHLSNSAKTGSLSNAPETASSTKLYLLEVKLKIHIYNQVGTGMKIIITYAVKDNRYFKYYNNVYESPQVYYFLTIKYHPR